MLVMGVALRKYARAEGSELVEINEGIRGLTLVALAAQFDTATWL